MSLTVILGPMKSGKSLEIIKQISPLEHTRTTHSVYQSTRHERDKALVSRSGASIPAKKVDGLRSILDDPAEVIAIDEIHLFTPTDIQVIRELLDQDRRTLYVAGLDLDVRGELFDSVKALMELGPDVVVHKKAVCDVCQAYNAVYTQVMRDGQPVTEGPKSVPDDGTGSFDYEARCRQCFVVTPVR